MLHRSSALATNIMPFMVLMSMMAASFAAADENPVEVMSLADSEAGRTLPSGVRLAGSEALAETSFQILRGAKAKRTIIEVKHEHFDKAARIQTIESSMAKWEIKLDVPLAGKVSEGDTLLIDFWMRTVASENESGDGAAFVALANNGRQWTTHRIFTASAGKAWRHWQMPVRLHKSPGPGRNILSLQFAGRPQTVDIAGLQVINYGSEVDAADLPMTRSTYPGREPDAAWRAEALKRIERIRKGELTVRVVDGEGKPVEGATINVAMQRHAFGFGCVLNPRGFARTDEDGKRYREIFLKYFNKAPLEGGLRWQNFFKPDPKRQKEAWANTSAAIDWLREHDIEVRGHYLMWGPINDKTKPRELLNKPEAMLAAHHAHMKEKIALTKGRIGEWDTINHIAGWGRCINDLPGGNRIYADTIKLARKLAPDAEHWINEGQIIVADGNRMDAYEAIIKDLIKLDAKPDGIGFMAHFRDTHLPDPREVYQRIERFAKFGTKLQYTELDVEAGADEKLQADYLRDVMIIGFSHPSMEGIVLWGFWEGHHWRPDAALWRRDWTIKPAGKVWIDLVFKQWWTNESIKTNAKGEATLRVFHGSHKISTGQTTRTIDVGPAGATAELRVGEARKRD